jgi:uroporphyrinogen-III decarboxylase
MSPAKDLELATLAAHMRELVGSPSFAAFCGQIDKMLASRKEQLESINETNFQYLQGQIRALRDVLGIPQTIIQRSKARG